MREMDKSRRKFILNGTLLTSAAALGTMGFTPSCRGTKETIKGTMTQTVKIPSS